MGLRYADRSGYIPGTDTPRIIVISSSYDPAKATAGHAARRSACYDVSVSAAMIGGSLALSGRRDALVQRSGGWSPPPGDV
jgi:hypothetical protein